MPHSSMCQQRTFGKGKICGGSNEIRSFPQLSIVCQSFLSLDIRICKIKFQVLLTRQRWRQAAQPSGLTRRIFLLGWVLNTRHFLNLTERNESGLKPETRHLKPQHKGRQDLYVESSVSSLRVCPNSATISATVNFCFCSPLMSSWILP